MPIFVILFSSLTNSQVIIKEKVEINPQNNIVPEYPVAVFTPCGPWITSYDEFNPWQVVWNQISFAPDPYQQMFNFQDNRYGPGLQRRTYILDPNKSYNLTIQQSDEYAYFTYGGFYDNATGSYVPIQYVGSTLSGVPGSDLGATGWYDYVQDYPNGLYHNDSKYRMKIKRDVPPGTEIIVVAFDGQQTINYHTRIETPTFTIENTTNEDTLLHYFSREIEFRLNFQQSGGSCQLDGYGGAYPVGIKFNVDIVQGQEYGNLYYPGTVADPEQSGTSITNIEDEYGIGIANYTIKYKADGVQPDSLSPGIVTIRCSSNDLDIAPVEVSFPVKYNTDPPEEGGIILVDFNKESFVPGDTATTNCKWLTAYNELLDFPAEQSFNVEITGGSEFGMLLDPNTGTIADNLQGVSNGFKVITATSIPYDSVVIRLKVNTTVEVNSSSTMITNLNPKSEIKDNNIADIDDGTKTITPDFFIITPGQEIEGFGDVVVKKDGCDKFSCGVQVGLPNIKYKQQTSGYMGGSTCASDLNLAGFFQVFRVDTGYIFGIQNACFDGVNNRWWFNLFDEYSFIVNYVISVCTTNITNAYKQLIKDYKYFPVNYGCDSIMRDLNEEKKYVNGKGHYVSERIILLHENEHLEEFQEILNDFLGLLHSNLISIANKMTCESFNSLSEAEMFWGTEINRIYLDWYESIYAYYLGVTRRFGTPLEQLEYETEIHNRILPEIMIYIDAAKLYHGCK